MAQLTGGSIEYERRIKTGDFEHKVLKATLTFSIPEGESNSNIDEVARSRALLLVEQGLLLKHEALSASPNPAVITLPKTEPAPTKRKAAPKPPPPTTNDVVHEDPAAIEGQVNGGKDRSVTELVKREPPPARILDTGVKVDPAAMTYPDDSRAASNMDLVTGAVPSSGIDRTDQASKVYVDEPVEPVKVEYADLTKAANAAMARGVNSERIHELVASYAVKKLSEIATPERRAAILLEINALK